MKTKTSIVLACLVAVPAMIQAETLALDPQSSWIKVDASATGHRFSGNLTKFKATITGDEAALQPKSATIEWNFSDLKTGDAKRDNEMLKWLDSSKKPGGSFSMNKSWVDKDGKTWAQGGLTVHGITKSISFPLTVSSNAGTMKIDGSVWIDYQDFNLPIIRNMAVMTVDPKLKISFHMEGNVK